jgi:hypothetical protein
MTERQRIVVTDKGTPIAIYERTGPGEWCMVQYCNQIGSEPAPPYPQVERSGLERWLAEQLS